MQDVADAFWASLESDQPIWDVFNIGSGKPITIADMAIVLARTLNKNIDAEFLGRYRVGDIRHCFPDISKAEKALGYKPRRSFDEGMQELISWVASTKAPVDRSQASMAELETNKLLV